MKLKQTIAILIALCLLLFGASAALAEENAAETIDDSAAEVAEVVEVETADEGAAEDDVIGAETVDAEIGEQTLDLDVSAEPSAEEPEFLGGGV